MTLQFIPSNNILSLAITLSLGIASVAAAQTTNGQATPAQRQKISERHKKMAEMHSKMAACIESNIPLSQCRQEMVDACSTTFGGTCPMMGKGRMGGGRGMGMMGDGSCMDWMMNPDAGASTPTPSKK